MKVNEIINSFAGSIGNMERGFHITYTFKGKIHILKLAIKERKRYRAKKKEMEEAMQRVFKDKGLFGLMKKTTEELLIYGSSTTIKEEKQ